MMTSAHVVEISANVVTNSPSQDYTYPDDHNLPTYDVTPRFKPFTNARKLHVFFSQELKLPFGHGFAFSRQWFKNHHGNRGEMDGLNIESSLTNSA